MIFDMVIYVSLINLTEMECILLIIKSCIFLCLCVLESFTLDKIIKMIFRGDVNVYRYSNLIKTDKYFRTNCCLVINLKQNRFEIK